MNKIPLILLLLISAIRLNAQVFKDITDVGANVSAYIARGSQAGSGASKAFDNNYSFSSSTIWYDAYNPSAASPSWIKVQFTSGQTLTAYSVTSSYDIRNYDPRDWAFQGSNDNSIWTSLDTRANINFNIAGETRLYSFSNSTSYTYYRLRVDETRNTGTTGVKIGEMQMIDNLILGGYVFKDNGDAVYGKGAQDTAFASVNVSIVDRNNTNVVTKQTNVSGYYSFSASDLMSVIGDFSVIVTPPSNYVFVSELPIMFRSGLSLGTYYYNAPCGSIVFACYKNAENANVLTNRFLFGAGAYNVSSLDFGMKRSIPSKLAAASGYAYSNPMTNLITAATNGTFGTWSPSLPLEHPTRPGFTDGLHTDLHYTLGAVSSYTFNATTNTSSGNGTLYIEGDYNTSPFFGTLQDIITGNSGAYQGSFMNITSGGFLKTYGATTADAYDMFMALNGAPVGTTPFFIQTGLSLMNNEEYMISMNAKGANSYVEAQNGLPVNAPQIVLEVFDNSSNLIYSATKSFDYSTSTATDLPYATWDQVNGVFTATSNGPFSVKIRASTGVLAGNDVYIDNISLFHVRRIDYGDAPASYGTATTMHLIYNSVMMGSLSIDSNKTSTASVYADGDDSQFSDDEDGISYLPPLSSSTTSYSVSVQATNTYGANGTLCGWVDFNGNGLFDSSEGSCVTVSNGFSGPVTLNWTTSNPVTTTYARFRITTDNMTVNNASSRMENGEVEDYWIDNSLLPIAVVDFNAVATEDKKVSITWTTASEINSDYFSVERSHNASDWEEVTSIDAAGFSNESLFYETIDETPYEGTSYYRLGEFDLDGIKLYSEIKMINMGAAPPPVLSISCDPVTQQIHFTLNESYTIISVRVIDVLGNESNIWPNNVAGYYYFNTDRLAAGAYLLAVQTEDRNILTGKFIVY